MTNAKSYYKIKLIIAFFLAVTLLYSTAVFAAPNKTKTVAGPTERPVFVPEHATLVAPGLYSLGETIDSESGQKVQGYMIVRPHKENKKPSAPGGGGVSTCYGYLAKGAKWKNVEPWVLNADGQSQINNISAFTLLADGISKWEDATDGVMNGVKAVDIVGSGATTSLPLVADETSTDGQNEVYFDLIDQGTIGVTIVWGVFGGPVQDRRLVEWDQIYNTYYDWATNGDSDSMDFDSIATHELGHTMGMADLYDSSCSQMTMYGYGDEGQTHARTLEYGDINGINALY